MSFMIMVLCNDETMRLDLCFYGEAYCTLFIAWLLNLDFQKEIDQRDERERERERGHLPFLRC